MASVRKDREGNYVLRLTEEQYKLMQRAALFMRGYAGNVFCNAQNITDDDKRECGAVCRALWILLNDIGWPNPDDLGTYF